MRIFIKWAFIRWLLMLAGLLWFLSSLSHPQMAVGAISIAPLEYDRVENSDSAWTYTGTWGHSTNCSPCSNGDHSFSYSDVSTASYTYFGKDVRLVHLARNDMGNVDIYVDDVFHSTYNQYNATENFLFTHNIAVSTLGTHTIRFERKTAALNIDALDIGIYETATPTLEATATLTPTLAPANDYYYVPVQGINGSGTFLQDTCAWWEWCNDYDQQWVAQCAPGDNLVSVLGHKTMSPSGAYNFGGSVVGEATELDLSGYVSRTIENGYVIANGDAHYAALVALSGITPDHDARSRGADMWPETMSVDVSFIARGDSGLYFEWEAIGYLCYGDGGSGGTATPELTATPYINTCWQPGEGTPQPDWEDVPPEYAICRELCVEAEATATTWAVPTFGCLDLGITALAPTCLEEAQCETATANPPTALPTLDIPGCHTPTVTLTATETTIDPICFGPPPERQDDPIVLDFGQVLIVQGECYKLIPGVEITIPAFLGLWEETIFSSYEWQVCVNWVSMPDLTIAGIEFTNSLIIGSAVLVLLSIFFKL